ncbi:MAG TPA: hypothetical protein VGO93_03240, partial [Candidatus Xenobia bacterium]
MAIDAASKPLTTTRLAMLPTHDPMVGRMVGSIFQYQGPKAVLKGKIDGTDAIDLTYAKAADGTVTCDGFFGDVEIHDHLAGKAAEGGAGGSSLFGLAGTTAKTQAATQWGTVNGQTETMDFTVERSTVEVPITDDLRARGVSDMTMSSQVLSSPSFGGAQVKTYLVPGHTLVESPALQAQDTLVVKGHSAGAAFVRNLQWNMTTWSKNWNDQEGWGHTQLLQVEDAQESDDYQAGTEKTYTDKPLEWH